MNRNSPSRLKLQTRLALAFVLVGLLASGSVSVISFFQDRVQNRQSMRDSLLNMVSLAVHQIDADKHALLQTPDDMQTPEFEQLYGAVRSILMASKDTRYVYTMRSTNTGEIQFVMDSDEDYAPIGEPYLEPSKDLRANFNQLNVPWVEQDFYTDEWGTWLSGYAPFFTLNGEREGVLGMDISADKVLAREREMLLMAGLQFLASIPFLALAGWFFGRTLARPIENLTETVDTIATGNLQIEVPLQPSEELTTLANAFNRMNRRVKEMIMDRERQIAERTRDLERHTLQLQAASDVAGVITTILDSDELISQVVGLIQQGFSLYYVGLFLVDEDNQWAVLKAGTGEAGQTMISRGHRIHVGTGMVGWTIINAQPRLASEAGEDAVRLSTPELPDTRSEAAIPLRSRGKVLGALTVQSDKPDAFDDTTLLVLQSLADQVGIALDNARLFTQSQQALEAMSQAYGQLTRNAWDERLRARPVSGYTFDGANLQPSNGRHDGDGLSKVALPIQVRGHVLGTLEANKPNAQTEWTKDELNLMNSMVEQLSAALESARLYEETQRRAERERLAGEITAKVRASNDPQVILRTAAEELRTALRAKRAQVLMQSAAKPGTAAEEMAQGEAAPDGEQAGGR